MRCTSEQAENAVKGGAWVMLYSSNKKRLELLPALNTQKPYTVVYPVLCLCTETQTATLSLSVNCQNSQDVRAGGLQSFLSSKDAAVGGPGCCILESLIRLLQDCQLSQVM